ncbi:MAG TPA: pyridoxamine 5'-phosphate oxidase family protein [Xanthobacteraceae bacterium]|jgi:predicted pyridoxine 5'-phosphate oxidase superfamily flavin-nucleotide-binding protein|nr:pyridoxamine 5'-phosphate oxidase family protein [Xanthobacteraceae bacterium]
MAHAYFDIAYTPSVRAAQAANGSRDFWTNFKGKKENDRFTAAEAEFIATRDSFYMASVSETGWPYVQHRGGPQGFLRVIDDKTLAFPDFRGNRQYISVGNVAANDRVALFLMDYPHQRRLKIYAHIEAKDLAADPTLAEQLTTPGYPAKIERAFVLHLKGFSWNCPQHITPRFTETEIDAALTPVRARIAQLEAENKMLRDKLGIAASEQDNGEQHAGR